MKLKPDERENFLTAMRDNTNSESKLPTDLPFERDIVYGDVDGRELLLDLFDFGVADDTPRPAIIFAHGGGWSGGGRQQFHGQCAYLALKHNFVAVTIQYRLSGEAPFPAAIQDVKCAVRWLRAQVAARRIDAARIAVGGGSAGPETRTEASPDAGSGGPGGGKDEF